QALKIVRVTHVGIQIADAIAFEVRVAGQGRRLTLPEIGPDQSQVFLGRIPGDADPIAKRRELPGLLHALAGAVVHPPVVVAADPVAFYPADAELVLAMGT